MEISPGSAFDPPPIIEAELAVWWGARNGLVKITVSELPRREESLVMAIASSLDGGGRRLTLVLARRVFPVPG